MKTLNQFLVFIVDDDKMFLKTMEHYITRFFNGIKVKAFLSGEECLKSINMNPDVIFLDYSLNSGSSNAMNGLKILDRIKKDLPKIPVVMLSGQEDIDIAVKTMKYGSFDYVIKKENGFMRVRSIIQNVIYDFRIKKEMKIYKGDMIFLFATIGITIAILILIQIFTFYNWF